MPAPATPQPQHVQDLLRHLEAAFESIQRQNSELAREVAVLRRRSVQEEGKSTHPLNDDNPGREENGTPKDLRFGETIHVNPSDKVTDSQEMMLAQAVAKPKEGRFISQRMGMLTSRETRPDRKTSQLDHQQEDRAGLLTKFEYLDKEGTGKLRLKDLLVEMEIRNFDVRPESLLEIFQQFGTPEAVTPVHHGASRFESRFLPVLQLRRRASMTDHGVDYRTFVRMMSEEVPANKLSDDALVCLKNLRFLEVEPLCTQAQVQQVMFTKGWRWHYPTNFEMLLETVPTVMILLNLAILGPQQDLPQYSAWWDALTLLFTLFYTCECIVKICFYGCHGYFRGDVAYWNIFDLLCVFLAVADTIMDMLGSRVGLAPAVRVARFARFVRLLRFQCFSELTYMVQGVISGLRVLTWAIVMLFALIYLLGIALSNYVGSKEPEFRNVPAAMFTLFRCFTDGCAAYDGTPLSERMRERYGFAFFISYVLMTMFVSVGIFNLIMALFVDKVVNNQLARKHKEMEEHSLEVELKFKRLLVDLAGAARARSCAGDRIHSAPVDLVNREWAVLLDQNVEVTRETFMDWLEEPKFVSLLAEADIETTNKFELFDVLDSDMGGSLSLRELATGLMKLRGPVTKADIVAVRLKVRHLTETLEEAISSMGVRR